MRSFLPAYSVPVSNPMKSAPRFGSVHIIEGFKTAEINTQLDVVDAFQSHRKNEHFKPTYSWWPLAGTTPVGEGEPLDCHIEIEDGVANTFTYPNCAAFIAEYENNVRPKKKLPLGVVSQKPVVQEPVGFNLVV